MSTIENLQLYDLLVEHFGSRQNIVSSCDSKGNICFYYPPRMEKLDINIGENRIVNLRSDSPANIEALTKFVEDMKSNEKKQETF